MRFVPAWLLVALDYPAPRSVILRRHVAEMQHRGKAATVALLQHCGNAKIMPFIIVACNNAVLNKIPMQTNVWCYLLKFAMLQLWHSGHTRRVLQLTRHLRLVRSGHAALSRRRVI